MQDNEITNTCIICASETESFKDHQIEATYHACKSCGFIYKDESFRMSKENEQEEYNRHNNSMENEGYVNMFEIFIKDHIEKLDITRKTLDFGSGPGPVLYQLMKNRGYDSYHFDPFYNNDSSFLDRKYQLITSTEVVEHFFDPIKEFSTLVSLLEEDGYLAIMTQFRTMNYDDFLKWWYRRDRTHVAFYNLDTFNYLCKKFNLKIVGTNNKNVVVLQKV